MISELEMTEQINSIIEQELRPRFKPFKVSVELYDVGDDGSVKINVQKGILGQNYIPDETVERIVESVIRGKITDVQRVVVTIKNVLLS